MNAATTHTTPKPGAWAWPPLKPPISPNPPLELQFLPPSSSSAAAPAGPRPPARTSPWTIDPSRLQKLMMGTSYSSSGDGVTPSSSLSSSATASTRGSLPDLGANSLDPDINKPLPCGWERCLDLKSGEVFIKKSAVAVKGTGSLMRTQVSRAQFIQRKDWKQPCTRSGRVPAQSAQEQRSDCSQKWMQGTMTLPWHPLANGSGRSHLHVQREEEGPTAPDKLEPLCLDLDLSLTSMSRSRRTSEALDMPSANSSIKVAAAAPASRGISRVHQSWKWQPPSTSYGNEKLTSIQEMISESTMATAVCSKCLMYVLLKKTNPTCPRCLNPIILDCGPQPSSSQKRPRLEISPDDLSLSTDSSR